VPAGPKQLERAAETRAALVQAGRRLFFTTGYFATATEDLVAEANVTRGALYHHFADKRDLFRAVFHAIGADVLANRIGALRAAPDPALDTWDQLRLGLHRFLRTVAESPEVQRVTIIDGPAVLGWQEWCGLEERYSLGRIEHTIERSIEQGVIAPQPPRALAHLLLGVVNSGALAVANSGSAEADVVQAVDALLTGLRRPSTSAGRRPSGTSGGPR
jgi:AcrR family transcriptional regulator